MQTSKSLWSFLFVCHHSVDLVLNPLLKIFPAGLGHPVCKVWRSVLRTRIHLRKGKHALAYLMSICESVYLHGYAVQWELESIFLLWGVTSVTGERGEGGRGE